MACQVSGDGTFARAGRSVNCDDDPAVGRSRGQPAFFRTHPRFLVFRLAGAEKLYRALDPALADAVNAGLRLS